MFIIRDMQAEVLVGDVFGGGRFKWYGVNAYCEMAVAHGLQLTDNNGTVLQQVYEIDEVVSGSGSVVVYGTPVYNSGDDSVSRTVTRSKAPVTPGDIQAERYRRLALGFDYDFGDVRGIHRIGTTDADMAGWREVTDLANARIALGEPTTPITIATDTGLCQVTPEEWQEILVAAAAFRQPIWASSFVLQAHSPIPTDYADDEHWS